MEFHRPTRSEVPQMYEFVNRHPVDVCQYSYYHLIHMWNTCQPEISMDDDLLVVRLCPVCQTYAPYFYPLGSGDIRAKIEQLIAFEIGQGRKLSMRGLTPEMQAELETLMPGRFTFSTVRDYWEYLYTPETLITLPGKERRQARQQLNAFYRDYLDRFEYERITPENIGQVLEYQAAWLSVQQNDDQESLMQEDENIRHALAHWDELRLSGGLIRIDDKLVGYAYGLAVHDGLYDLICSKADRGYNGLYKGLQAELVRDHCRQYEYVTLEDDMGLAGLRQLKQSYGPEKMGEKISAYLVD